MAGLYFDELSVGQIFRHEIRRTITEADNVWFSALTHNPAYLHLDEEYCRNETEFGRRIVNSAFTLGLMVGISVGDTTLGTAVANLGWDEVRMPNPVFEGDTIYSRSKVLAVRSSKSRPQIGIVTVATEGFNQDGVVVISYRRTFMVYRRGHLPAAIRNQPDESSLPPVDGN